LAQACVAGCVVVFVVVVVVVVLIVVVFIAIAVALHVAAVQVVQARCNAQNVLEIVHDPRSISLQCPS
jgi:hypothetical protein